MTAEPGKPAHHADHADTNVVWRGVVAFIDAVIRIMPRPIRERLQTEAGTRFTRFLPVALAALASSQITLAILTGLTMSAGKAALLASIVGAGVSYVLSRWAWERKGRPDLLRETVPFWLVSFAVWGFLSLVTHYAGAYAIHHNLHHFQRHLVVQGTYLAANCITFVMRFLIFHYVLFKRREPVLAADEAPATAAAGSSDEPDAMALTADSSAPRQPKH
jgi:putative flippase GtrA